MGFRVGKKWKRTIERERLQNEAARSQENYVGVARSELSSATVPPTQPAPVEPDTTACRPYSETCPWFNDHMNATLEAIIEHREFSWCVRAKQRTDVLSDQARNGDCSRHDRTR